MVRETITYKQDCKLLSQDKCLKFNKFNTLTDHHGGVDLCY